MNQEPIYRTIRRLEIRTRRLVDTLLQGDYRSVFKGRGMEFREVREYQPGDDVRDLDWNVTARMGHPYVKQFNEERELVIMLVVDGSGSCGFGTRDQLKSELASQFCASILFSALRGNDRAGLLLFSDKVERYIPPGKGSRHILRILRELLTYDSRGKQTQMGRALHLAGRLLKQRNIIFLISDFLGQDIARELAHLRRKHDVIGVHLLDQWEQELPDLGLVLLEDPETGMQLEVDTGDPGVRSLFEKAASERRLAAAAQLREAGVDMISLSTGSDFVIPLLHFFRVRERRKR
ncbi:MAG: DUF58 domain-containing protein [Armatimonadetes bacterium]|nr:DUF58 domain-containing protein [Armatimonadota bacterium]